MLVNFYKLEGTGNDFILLDFLRGRFSFKSGKIVKLCERHFGIGADGVLVLLKARGKGADFQMRIFNSDGTEAEMCGNGIRCVARYIYEKGLSRKSVLKIETLAGLMEVERRAGLFRVRIGKPEFSPEKVPVLSDEPVIDKPLKIDGEEFRVTCVSVGNPHCVIPVESLEGIEMKQLGPVIEHHQWFPNRVNVEFVEVISQEHLKVRVWERGAGETLACGTGACATLAACVKLGLAKKSAKVSLPGGDLLIELENNFLYLTGPARLLYKGQFDPKNF